MKPSAYLDAAKAQLNIETDYALAKRLEVTRGQILAMRNNTRPIPLAVAFKLAITLELDPARVVADLEEQREKNPKRREFWQGFLSRAVSTLAVVLVTLALSLSGISGNEAARLGGKTRRFNCA